MSRTFTDDSLMTWEAFASTGPFGLPRPAKIIFQCLSDPGRRARYVEEDLDEATAERTVHGSAEQELRRLLTTSRELD
jgi:hypothetical protein